MAAQSRESCQIILCPGFLAASAALLQWIFLQALPSTQQQNLGADLFRFISAVISTDRLRWSSSGLLAFGTQVRGFKAGRSRRIFKGEKILSTPSFGRGSKAVCPMSQICGMQKISRITWKSNSRRNLSEHFSPTKSSTFRC